jgi:hypothetical protein
MGFWVFPSISADYARDRINPGETDREEVGDFGSFSTVCGAYLHQIGTA